MSFAFLKSGIALYTGIALMAITLVIAAWILTGSAPSREIRVLNRFLRKLKALGYQKGSSEGLEEFVARIPDENIRKVSLEFVRNFERIYYTDRPFLNEDLRLLQEMLERIDDAR